jgi:hypothetical protein
VTRRELTGIVAVSVVLTAAGMWRAAAASSPPAAPAAPAREAVATNPPAVVEPPPRRVALPRPTPPAPPSEAARMAHLRDVKDSDPELAVELARDDGRQFPDDEGAPERASILIHALARLGRSSEARGEAEDMVNRYADTEWVREIERFTGAHRRRNLRLDDGGALESY